MAPVTGVEPSNTIKKLQERRANVWEQCKTIADRAADEERALTGEEERQWRALDAELDKLDERIEDIANGEKRAAATEATIASIAAGPVVTRSDGSLPVQQGSYEELNAELRRFVLGEVRTFEVRMPTVTERRDLTVTGSPMPTGFIHQLYQYLVDTSSIRQAGATVIATTSGENLVVPRSTAEGSALWTAEGGTLSASDPTLSSVTLGAFKLGKIIQISHELATDVGFDLVGYLAQSAGRNIGIASNTAYISGTGTTQPLGFVGSATVALTAATGTGSTVGLPTAGASVGADVLIDLYHSVIPQYRPRGSFMMADATVKAVRKLKDNYGRYLWEPSLQTGQPDTILGKPVYSNPAMDTFGVSKKVMAFGDFSAYYIRDVSPLRFERSDEYAFGTDLVSFRALFRTDGALIDTTAVKTYQCGAS